MALVFFESGSYFVDMSDQEGRKKGLVLGWLEPTVGRHGKEWEAPPALYQKDSSALLRNDEDFYSRFGSGAIERDGPSVVMTEW